MISTALAQTLRDTLEMQIAGENGDEELAERYEARRNECEKTLPPDEVEVAQMFAGDTADSFRLLRKETTADRLMHQTRAESLAQQTTLIRVVSSLAGKTGDLTPEDLVGKPGH
jgi:hypothetical protein